MHLKNTKQSFGIINLILHWVIALMIFILLPLGLWMTGLDYYDPWYKKAPDIHRSLGVITAFLIIIRIIWRSINIMPDNRNSELEHRLARAAHIILYLIPVLLIISGYLISTADGRAIEIFDWFSIPAVSFGIENQESVAGKIHYILGLALIFIIVVHIAGTLKHHWLDKDNTLLRIFGKSRREI